MQPLGVGRWGNRFWPKELQKGLGEFWRMPQALGGLTITPGSTITNTDIDSSHLPRRRGRAVEGDTEWTQMLVCG